MNQLFSPDQAPRRPRRVMMHVVDAGQGMVELQCAACGHNTGWVQSRTVTEERRGRPCPNCNPESILAPRPARGGER